MTINRDHGLVMFECDDCGEVFDSEIHDFSEAWQAAKEEGWVAAKLGGKWEHFCPECKGKDAA